MLFKLSNLNSNLALTLGYLNPALNNSALMNKHFHGLQREEKSGRVCNMTRQNNLCVFKKLVPPYHKYCYSFTRLN